jgi:hypothetical protein
MAKPKLIRSVLESALKGLEIDFQLKAYSIWGAWEEIVGEPVAHQTQPRSIRNRILFVDVSHPTWVQQLQFLKPQLLEKLNGFFGEPLLQDIRFRLGKIPPPHPPPSKADRWHEEELDQETVKRMEALLEKVEDGEMKRSLRDLLVKGAKLEHSRHKSK